MIHSPRIWKTTFRISKMDCCAEEQLIRMKLDEHPDVLSLKFQLGERLLDVFHANKETDVGIVLDSLNLGSQEVETTEAGELPETSSGDLQQRRLLWTVLIINAVFFLGELLFGFLANSMGLVADSLDMLADAMVYGLSLLVVGRSAQKKKAIARVSGYLQFGLAALGLIEVVRRFLSPGTAINYQMMVVVAFAALVGNTACLYILKKGEDKEAHMQASMIFTSNDILINVGVILAGFLVYALDSRLPDLIIGSVVFVLVTQGAFRIMKLSKPNPKSAGVITGTNSEERTDDCNGGTENSPECKG